MVSTEFDKRLEANIRESLRFAVGQVDEEAVAHMVAGVNAVLNHPSAPAPSSHLEGPQPCGIADPSTRDCPNMKEVGGGMDGERYRCDVCGKGYFLDYEEMK